MRFVYFSEQTATYVTHTVNWCVL